MADDAVPPPTGDLSVLRSMSARLRAGQHLDPHEVERALESGFGALIGLEAELSRIQHAAAAEHPGARAAAEHRTAQAAASADLKLRIDELREALTHLRTMAVPRGESRVGYGFVLPGQRQRFHAHRN